MAYNTINTHDEEFHTVALKVAYRLEAAGGGAPHHIARGLTHRCEVVTGTPPGRLLLSDEFDGEMNRSSVRAESDIAPFKPRCDVVLRATARAPAGTPCTRWPARLRVSATTGVVIDKTLDVCGPRWFQRSAEGWSLTDPEASLEVPMRWERAFGGRSVVAHPESTEESPRDPLFDESCTSNPVGCGWMEARYPDHLQRAGGTLPDRLPAPQVEAPDARVTGLVVAEHPKHALDAREMAEYAGRYGQRPAGFGIVGRPWAPRLAKAGTFDEHWLRDRHPFLPDDFSFAYWNAAPDDQQIDHPAPGLRVELWNLTEHSVDGYAAFELPPHRAFVMAWTRGLPLPVPAVIDTITVDAEAMIVTCVWRVLITRAAALSTLEARFEVDPKAPLLKLELGGSRG